MKKTFMSTPLVIRILSFFLLLVEYPFIRILFEEFKVVRLIICLVVGIVLIFTCVMVNIMKIVVYDNKFVNYRFKKLVFNYDSIESIELNNMGLIVVKYNGETYKLRGVLSLLDQMPSNEKNQEIIDLINEKRNKEELVYTKTDEVLEEKEMNLF